MANFNFNKVILGGRLTADPELKTTPSGIPVTSFTVAVNRRSKSEDAQADFLNVTAWRQTAEFVTRYFRKGSSICVVGSIQTRSWTDQSGQKRFATEIVADEAFFVDAKSESPLAVREAAAAGFQNTPAQSPAYVPEGYSSFGNQNVSGSQQNQTAPKFEDLSDDEELPF
ncbi:MAG: single-stranded DNA-binding protein [Clostridiales bacterium]|nr:single-stranded DNA-binding protein [Clostridiales bacterium]